MNRRAVVIGLLALSFVTGSEAQDAATRNGVLLFAYRTHGHVRYSKPEEFTGIVDDLISFLKSKGVPVANDLIHRPVVTEQASTDTFVTYLRQIGAKRLLLLTVDRPFTAKLELVLQCYDPEGKLLWEEKAREKPLRESVAVAQATEELHRQLSYRMQELRDDATPFTAAVAKDVPAMANPPEIADPALALKTNSAVPQQAQSSAAPAAKGPAIPTGSILYLENKSTSDESQLFTELFREKLAKDESKGVYFKPGFPVVDKKEDANYVLRFLFVLRENEWRFGEGTQEHARVNVWLIASSGTVIWEHNYDCIRGFSRASAGMLPAHLR